CGLQANTQYSYRVGGKDQSGKEAWSDVYQFGTAPDLTSDPTAQVTIIDIGDTRGNYTEWGNMLQLANQTAGHADLVIFSGDGVTLGTIQTEWDAWFMQASPVLRTVPMLGAHGNHDINSVNYYSQFAFPGDEANYGVDYGPIHLTVANDTPLHSDDVTNVAPQFLMSEL